jgi:sortase A
VAVARAAGIDRRCGSLVRESPSADTDDRLRAPAHVSKEARDLSETANRTPGAREAPVTRRLLRTAGVAFVVLAAALVMWAIWPELEYGIGLVDTGTSPYPTKLDSVEGPGPDGEMPRGDRLVIPEIGLDVGVYEGDADACLRRGTWHDSDSAHPGQDGNVVIAGHRNRGVFVPLHYLAPGDAVILYWRGEELDYEVDQVLRVDADDDSVLAGGDGEMLTLYTCTPRWIGDRRVVVRALPMTE